MFGENLSPGVNAAAGFAYKWELWAAGRRRGKFMLDRKGPEIGRTARA